MRHEQQALEADAFKRSGKRGHRFLAASLQGAVQGLRSARAARSQVALEQKGALFCYALVRAPPFREKTAPLLARQLSKACDGWALFSSAEDLSLNITKAYSQQDEHQAVKHQMHEMIAAGAWRKLTEMGVMYHYTWILKVDADTYVRPSTLRRAFGKISPNSRSILSVGDTSMSDGLPLDGFFLAIPVSVGISLLEGPAPDCDVVLSGHNEDLELDDGAMLKKCLQNSQFDGFATLRDAKGHAMVAFDQDEEEKHKGDVYGPQEYGPKVCQEMAAALLKHFGSKHSSKQPGPLCECTLGGMPRPTCVSEDFAAVHKVVNEITYRALMETFS